MKKLLTPSLLAITLVFTSFNYSTKPSNGATHYAFVTDTEHDKAFDEPTKFGYVDITTNIVTVQCDLTNGEIKSQYIDHYAAEQETQNRERAFIGAEVTSVWIYDNYDEAYNSRREWEAKSGVNRKRRIENLYIICND